MSRINAIRIVNLNYNNNAIHVDDEIFELGSESTLFSLRNGGGKSVLVQMMSAPFVRKRYRDTKDRPFESYFTSSRPTYILVEWALDNHAGYVLTGMMVRKAAERLDDENQDPLDTVQFIYEYSKRNEYDIYQFPLISQAEDAKKLLGFGAAKQLFEELKKNMKYQFNYYDMNLYHQNQSYFKRLKEFGINHKEWESIIKKINLKESGLSELFAEAKDEVGLVDKWFLPAIEDKLNKDETSRIDKFVELIQKYIFQYRENRSNFAKKETIECFKNETKALIELATEYQSKISNQKELENYIANLVLYLKQMLTTLELSMKEGNVAIDRIKSEMNRIECSEIAYQIYVRQDALNERLEQMKACDELLKQVEQEMASLNQTIKKYECSKVYGEQEASAKEMAAIQAKLDTIHRRNEDLTPERDNLGYSIHRYYQEKSTKLEELLNEQKEALQENQKSQENSTASIEQYNQTIASYSEEIGIRKSNKKSYARAEEEFNVRYDMRLSRNIVGSYEDGYLEKISETLIEEEVALNEEKKQAHVQEENVKHRLEEKEHRLNELKANEARLEMRIQQLEKQEKEYERMLAERRALLPYVNLTEEDIFETAKIVDEFEKKIKEISNHLRDTVILEDSLCKELLQLKSGKLLELPKELEEKLIQQEFHYIYGTEWLKNNGKTVEENNRIVKANPFLPYSIILGMADYERLKSTDLGVFTSFPIPIVKREDLVHCGAIKDSKVISYPEISFYVAFNHNLLDNDGLNVLIEGKESEVEGCRKQMKQLEDEEKLYEDKRNFIFYQGLKQHEVDQCKKELTKSIKNQDMIQLDLSTTMDEVKQLKQKQLLLIRTVESIDNALKKSKEKQTAFHQLKTQYEEYIKDIERLAYLEDETKKLKLSINSIKLALARLKAKQTELNNTSNRLTIESNKVQEKMRLFESFKEGDLLDQSIEEMEARYQTITQNLFQEESILMDQLAALMKKKEDATAELDVLMKNYQLREEDFKALNYQAETVVTMKNQLIELSKKKDQTTEEKRKISNETASLNTEISVKKRDYEKKSGGRELIPRNLVVQMDFEAELHKKYLDKVQRERELALLQGKMNDIKTVLVSLSEYETIIPTQPIVFQISEKEILDVKNKTLRNYKLALEEVSKYRLNTVQEIGKLLRNDRFEDDYYHKPLESLERIVDQPEVILEQLHTTIQAYDNLLDKLSVDLQMIEQEAQKVIDVLLQYVQEVHENLGRIDRNSTITIRERNIKMLRIKLSSWEEEKKTYAMQCKDLFEQVVNRSLELLDENKNIEEYVASQITTKNLYHTVVGGGNIGIHLYKIEEEREYPITWAEVSKNSGGEGFLSAFVILSSLLSYMRREDTDIFNDKDNGKVIIMDNPFAQTNASHLLKPLMDIAKKSNTQLICLSGLGGESIYNRFDNIYVLNLISSKIKDSIQYLYGDHMKGEDLESIVSARIQIEEEQMVLF